MDVGSQACGNGCQPGPIPSGRGGMNGTQKKGGTRKNAWGGKSYADLITMAIKSAPEGRLTLAQIYDWVVSNVPYFRDKGDANSSAGWKVGFCNPLS